MLEYVVKMTKSYNSLEIKFQRMFHTCGLDGRKLGKSLMLPVKFKQKKFRPCILLRPI